MPVFWEEKYMYAIQKINTDLTLRSVQLGWKICMEEEVGDMWPKGWGMNLEKIRDAPVFWEERYIMGFNGSNYQKRIRLTFVDDYFDEKWEEKVIFLCIIDCIKKKFFK